MLLLLLGCAPPDITATQPPIQVMLTVHADPLPRLLVGCEDDDLTGCGTPVGRSWYRRTRNATWLLERWLETGRTVDLQVGPEIGLSWSGDADTLAALAEDPDLDDAFIAEQITAVQDVLSAALSAENAALGVHLHTVAEDASGLLGVASRPDGVHPCAAWSGEPLTEADPAVLEDVVGFGVRGVASLADVMGTPLASYTGHLPASLSGKIAMVTDPTSIVPDLPTSFAPTGLSSAYSECFFQQVDHPPFELWRADDGQALLAGEGPVVLPGERVVGSMAEHLEAPTDGTWAAASRRLIQLLISWRHAALTGQAARPWAYTFHVHLYQLEPGLPDPDDPAARHDIFPDEGQPYRGDVEGIAGMLDVLSDSPTWQGAGGSGVVQWVLPEDLSAEGSQFSYGTPDAPPPDGLDAAQYPYLLLVAERLAESHLACSAMVEGVAVYRFLRCPSGWQWGGPGSRCLDPVEPVFALIPQDATCLAVPDGLLSAASVDAEVMSGAEWCSDGRLSIPIQGLLVEPAEAGTWWSEVCGL
ncbi:MAG: hypothetical protein ACI8RZ_008019 [Myxococcota bacterium]